MAGLAWAMLCFKNRSVGDRGQTSPQSFRGASGASEPGIQSYEHGACSPGFRVRAFGAPRNDGGEAVQGGYSISLIARIRLRSTLIMSPSAGSDSVSRSAFEMARP